MSDPFLSEIRIMAFNFPPKGWTLCNGQLLPINQNQALFALLGTTYGGNGQTNFALPNLRGRAPVSWGNGFTLGQAGGEEAHTITIQEMPAHTHSLQALSTAATTTDPTNAYLAATESFNRCYTDGAIDAYLQPHSGEAAGGSQAHTNMQPYTVLSFCIALQGIFPSQN